jgi:hypothetical protein
MNKYIDAYNTMGNSGNDALDAIFKFCVIILVDLADFLGVSYEALNIILFIIIHPSITVIFFILWRREKNKIIRS